MSEWAIVAIPKEGELVHRVSSEPKAHMTLLYLGAQPIEGVSMTQIVQFLEHAVSQLSVFGVPVERRAVLGDEDADVLLIETQSESDVEQFRSHLLSNDMIKTAYNSASQYPEWTPHITLGYPQNPANDSIEDYPITWVNFDRIALWVSDYEGPEFLMHRHESWMTMSLEGELSHYGVKGMRWGRRRITANDIAPSTVSKDHSDAKELKKKKLDQLSNADLRKLNERMQLERSYSQLMATQKTTISRGHDHVKSIVSIARTLQDVYNIANSPAAKAVRELVVDVVAK